jgi:hypothetical protein
MKATGIVRRIDDLNQRRRSTGDFHRPRRRSNFKKIFSGRRTWKICRRICRITCTDERTRRMHHGPRSDRSGSRRHEKRIYRQNDQRCA